MTDDEIEGYCFSLSLALQRFPVTVEKLHETLRRVADHEALRRLQDEALRYWAAEAFHHAGVLLDAEAFRYAEMGDSK